MSKYRIGNSSDRILDAAGEVVGLPIKGSALKFELSAQHPVATALGSVLRGALSSLLLAAVGENPEKARLRYRSLPLTNVFKVALQT